MKAYFSDFIPENFFLHTPEYVASQKSDHFPRGIASCALHTSSLIFGSSCQGITPPGIINPTLHTDESFEVDQHRAEKTIRKVHSAILSYLR